MPFDDVKPTFSEAEVNSLAKVDTLTGETPKMSPQVGDVVILKSGGPKMTITALKECMVVLQEVFFKRAAMQRLSGKGAVVCFCEWFDNDFKPHKDSFPAKALIVADPGKVYE